MKEKNIFEKIRHTQRLQLEEKWSFKKQIEKIKVNRKEMINQNVSVLFSINTNNKQYCKYKGKFLLSHLHQVNFFTSPKYLISRV